MHNDKNNKRHDMARSILPSSRRSGARNDKRNESQRYRRTVNNIINTFDMANVDDYDAFHADMVENETWHKRNVKELVSSRRDGDKINPVQVWAVAVTKDMRIEDRTSYMRGILPDNLIGRHALSHIENLDEFEVPDSSRRYFRYFMTADERAEQKAYFEAKKFTDYCTLYDTLYSICTTKNMCKLFNAHMKRNYIKKVWTRKTGYQDVEMTGRPLRGTHDINSFLVDCDKSYELRGRLKYWLELYEKKNMNELKKAATWIW
jgi:hypothetical protein